MSRRHMRLPLLLLAPLLTIGCVDTHSAPTEAGKTAFAQTSPMTGKPVKFSFYTHCGVESARIAGHWWHAATPLYGDGGPGVGPPAGWGDPHQEGLLIVESPDRAVFTAKGTEVVLSRAPSDRPVRVCR